jgi:hypothetical protein
MGCAEMSSGTAALAREREPASSPLLRRLPPGRIYGETLSGAVFINRSQPKEKVEKIRYAIERSKPYGSEGWVSKAAQFGLENTVRNRGRPGKGTWNM